jgi:hypothetical protein
MISIKVQQWIKCWHREKMEADQFPSLREIKHDYFNVRLSKWLADSFSISADFEV